MKRTLRIRGPSGIRENERDENRTVGQVEQEENNDENARVIHERRKKKNYMCTSIIRVVPMRVWYILRAY